MRPLLPIVVSVLVCSGLLRTAVAQAPVPVTPSQPTSFKKRDLGTTIGSGVGIGSRNPKLTPAKRVFKTVQYIGIAPERGWKNEKGKTIRGTLLAFENGPKEKVIGPLTLIRDGKVRLLRAGANKPSVFPLSVLSPADQKFIRALDAENKKQGQKQKATPEPAKPAK